MKKSAFIYVVGPATVEAVSMLKSRGWEVVFDQTDAEAIFVMRGWRDDPVLSARVDEARSSGRKMYWDPNPPPKVNCADFYEISGSGWRDITRPRERDKGRTTFACGGNAFEVWPVIECAVKCGHKVSASMSPYSDTTVVATIFADRKRTFVVKLWCSNRTQAANVMEDVSALEIGGLA